MIMLKLGRQRRPNAADALKCEDLEVKFNVNDAHIQLDNLFGGDNELGKQNITLSLYIFVFLNIFSVCLSRY